MAEKRITYKEFYSDPTRCLIRNRQDMDIVGISNGSEVRVLCDRKWGEYFDYNREPLTFKMLSEGPICFEKQGSVSNFTVEYKINDGEWTSYTVTNPGNDINLSTGDKISWRCPYGNHPYSKSYDNYVRFRTIAEVEIYGNIASTRMDSDYETPWLNNRLTPSTRFAFNRMFVGCSGYIDASNLIIPMPGTADQYAGNSTCESYCADMFSGCTGLVKAPDLSKLKITGRYSHAAMFYGCTSLVEPPPLLPCTQSSPYCYRHVFWGCTSLTKSPVIAIKTLDSYGYDDLGYMFEGCTSLREVTLNDVVFYSLSSSTRLLTNWLNNVADEGKIYLLSEEYIEKNSASGIPTGWNAVNTTGLCVTNINTEESVVALNVVGNLTTDYETSPNGYSWEPYTMGTEIHLLNTGDKVYFRGTKSTTSSDSNRLQFSMTGKTSVSGNIKSLLRKTRYDYASFSDYVFCDLFRECEALVDASELELTTSIGSYCFLSMFESCTSLVKAPKLPATSLSAFCYADMFKLCTSLEIPPELPATSLNNYCYSGMFWSSGVTKIPDLPVKVLSYYGSYQWMFGNCTNIRSAKLYAKYTYSYAYRNMFENCINLNEVYVYTESSQSSENWLLGVSETGTIYLNRTLNLTRGPSGIPNGWVVKDLSDSFSVYVAETDLPIALTID